MKKALRTRLAKIIPELEGVRCVYITKRERFFVFKKAFRDHEEVSESYSADENGRPYFDGWVGRVSAFDGCVILHYNKLIQGKRTKPYIVQYREIIDQSPEFLIDDILKGTAFRIPSKKYLTPIKKLFRAVFSLKDGRADRKPVDPIVIMRSNFFVRYYKQRGCPKRIPMQDTQDAWRKQLDKRFPGDAAAVDKYSISDDAVRRCIKCRIK